MKEEIEIPIEHKQIALSRIKKSKLSPERMLDWAKVVDKQISAEIVTSKK
ncbi:MAG: hypothetical protein ABWY22_03690 [Flavobacterium sp.]